MFDVIKKTLLAGVGAVVITKEKAEVVFDDFVQQGKVSAADAKVMAQKIAQQGRDEFATVSREIEKKLKGIFAICDAATRERIAELEARLDALENKPGPAHRPHPAQPPEPSAPSV